MSAADARYVAAAFALVLIATTWGLWPQRAAFAARVRRVACRVFGHRWRFLDRADVHEHWAMCETCGERRRGW